tara:strand:- start:1482 stop:2339 length:858 start_codon:yes stop_codon:yes gene_type:complete
MTAYARSEYKESWGTCIWEIRSVNQRYLECSFRLPETYRSLEPVLREKIRQRVQRGKIEINLRIQNENDHQEQLQLNNTLAQQLITSSQQLEKLLPEGQAQLNIMDILRWPGVITPMEQDQSVVQKTLLKHTDALLDQFIQARQREGQATADLMLQKIEGIQEHVDLVCSKMPVILQWQKDKLNDRLKEITEDLDPSRLEQEMLFLAQKIDVAEEMERLQAHIKETQRILAEGGACGRRLDFMMQEFNRESNTLASKSIHSDITNSAIELKVLIEQMREQIQNIE